MVAHNCPLGSAMHIDMLLEGKQYYNGSDMHDLKKIEICRPSLNCETGC